MLRKSKEKVKTGKGLKSNCSVNRTKSKSANIGNTIFAKDVTKEAVA